MLTLHKCLQKRSHLLLRTPTRLLAAPTMHSARQQDDDLLDPEARERQTNAIMQRIAIQKEEIEAKTKRGRQLAANAAEGIHFDQFEREQRYEIFINKMFQLYKYEKRALKKQRAGFLKMTTAPLMSETPVKLILSEYAKLSSQGFDGRLFSQTLEHLVQTVHGRGNNPRVFSDYSLPEMDTSWRMSKVAEDLKYALTSDQFFSSHLLAKTSRLMGQLGYKNSEILPLWFQKMDQIIQSDRQSREIPEADTHQLFNSAVYGSYFNLKPRHYVYQGHFQHEEFQSHLQTLSEWRQQPTAQIASSDREAQELQEAMSQLIDQVKEIKGLQEEQQAAIASLREQFFRLKEAQDKHEFLRQNKYLRYDMLELQELLVKGGFINPDEALKVPQLDQAQKMSRAVDVFYDFVLNQHQELMSPQYEQLIDATKPSTTKKVDLLETQNQMNAHTYSSTVIGIAQQVQSYRRDVHGYDYPNKFYEDMLMPPEYLTNSEALTRDFKRFVAKNTPTNVLMERSYLKPWMNFYKETENLDRTISELISGHKAKSPRFVESNITSLRALSECKFSAKKLRERLYKNIQQHKDNIAQVESYVLIDGLVGIALGTDRGESAMKTASILVNAFGQEKIEALKFSEKIELLNSICVANMLEEPTTKQKATKVATMLINSLDDLWFDNTENELTLNNFELLNECYLTIKTSPDAKIRKLNFKNTNLLSALENPDVQMIRYPEHHSAQYDPLKPRIVSGLAAGLNSADMEILHQWQQGQSVLQALDGKNKFPYQPDILLGHKGTKLGIFLTNQRETMRDTQEADGRSQHRMKILQRSHEVQDSGSQIVPVTIPISAVVDYDLENFKLSLKDNFDLSAFIGKAQANGNGHQISTGEVAELASKLATRTAEAFEGGRTTGQFEKLLSQFYALVDCRQRVDAMYEPEQLDAGFDEMKFHLMKLSLVHDLLSEHEKQQVQACIGKEKSLAQLISDLKTQITASQETNRTHPNFKQPALNAKLAISWLGTRQSVELPGRTTSKKDIEPELLNRSFMFVEDYHHYKDWQKEMELTYDQFNLLQLPHSKNDIKYYYDSAKHNRRIPVGIFPHPAYKRTVLEHNSTEQLKIESGNRDRFAEFEKDPMKYMRTQELKKAKELREITTDVSMMCNLQNIKHGLKSEMSDKQLADFLFNKLSFTNQLIDDHLKQLQRKSTSNAQGKQVPRDAKAFREFMERKGDFTAPYTQFYLREAVKQGFPQGLYDEYRQAARDPKQQEKAQKLLEQLENSLINYRRGKEDFFNLSKALDNHLDVKVDIEALGVMTPKVQTDIVVSSMSDDEFLRSQRVQAESALIKSTIVYKCHNDIQLNPNEAQYAALWMKAAEQSQSLVTGATLMVPENPASLKLSDLSPEDFYAFNSLTGVELNREKHGTYSLNELVLELGHLIERDTLRKVELKMLEDKLKQEFGIGQNFSLVEKRNNEIDHLHQELEEVLWRKACRFSDKDKTAIKSMFSIGRGIDHFDKVFHDLDLQSFNAFFDEANSYENRATLIENWLCRKEEEYRKRVNLPTQDLRKSDQVLFAQFDSGRKKARETLVSKMLVSDEFGAAKSKSYTSLTTSELHMLVESLCVRLNLFNQKYPAFLPQVVLALMQHPNLALTDRSLLDSYCTLFELDWRGDRNIDNKEEFLMTNPIYIDERDSVSSAHLDKYTESYIQERLQKASIPFLDEVVKRMSSQTGK